MASEPINPVAMVAREIKAGNVSFKQMGDRVKRDPSSVQVMLTKNNMSVERLLACSKALNYNFFLEIGYLLPYPGPVEMKGNPLMATVSKQNADVKAKDTTIEELQKQIAEAELQRLKLQTELDTLKQLMRDIFTARQT